MSGAGPEPRRGPLWAHDHTRRAHGAPTLPAPAAGGQRAAGPAGHGQRGRVRAPRGTPEVLRGAPGPGLSGGSLRRASSRGCAVPGVTLKSVAVLPRSVSRTWSGPGPGSSARTPPPCPTPPLGPRPQSVKASHSAAILARRRLSRDSPRLGGGGGTRRMRGVARPHGAGGNGRRRSERSGRGAESGGGGARAGLSFF